MRPLLVVTWFPGDGARAVIVSAPKPITRTVAYLRCTRRRATLAAMRWILRRWLLAGGTRSFLAGYAGLPLLIALVATIVVGIHGRREAGLLIPGTLFACFVAPVGPVLGILVGISPGWGPWDGRLVYMGLMAGLVALVIAGRWLEKRHPVPNGGDDTPHVPSARVVTAHLFPTTTWNRLIGCLATVPWKQLIGPVLLVIAGVGFLILGCVGWAALAAGA